jgi:hypothetical protein
MRGVIKISCFLIVLLAFNSCGNKAKVIEAETQESETASSIFSEEAAPSTESNEKIHEVVAKEVLNTDRYTYIRVLEDKAEYWVAVSKRDIQIGETYIYERGLLKQNFYSPEFNRTFETVYLVSDLRDRFAVTEAGAQQQPPAPVEVTGPIKPAAGATPIADIFKNPSKYGGKVIKVTGQCVKVNSMIMNRNWIHLQDGSGNKLDLTVTTTENIPLGAVVTMEGTLALKKDFGAGYSYDIILEGAKMK